MSFKGNLKSFSLAEIFQSLSLNRHNGTLRICQQDGTTSSTRFIHFGNGYITFVSPGSPDGFKIGEILSRKGIIEQQVIDEALSNQDNQDMRIGEILLQDGIVSEEDITQALIEQLHEEIYDLFLIKKAEFEFQFNTDPPYYQDPLQKAVKISLEPQAIIMEGVRRLDEWDIIRTNLQTFDEIFTPTGVQPDDLHEEEALVYRLIDGATPVHKLFYNLPFGRFSCTRAIFNLTTAGLIRPLTSDEMMAWLRAEEADDKQYNPEKRLHFLTFALQTKPNDAALRLQLVEHLIEHNSKADFQKAIDLLQAGLALEEGGEGFHLLAARFVSLLPSSPKALAAAIKSNRQTGKLREAITQTLALTEALKRNNQTDMAVDALTSIDGDLEEFPELRIRVADQWRDMGMLQRSLPHLDIAAGYHERRENWHKLNKILRWILDADPNRQDARFKLDQIALKIQTLDRKKRRKTILIAVAILLVSLLAAAPLVYQSRANIAFASLKGIPIETLKLPERPLEMSDQARLYQLQNLDTKLTEYISAYNQFKQDYPYSPLVGDADQALAHLKGIKQTVAAKQKRILVKTQRAIQAKREMPKRLFQQAQALVNNGKLEQAHKVYHQLLKTYPESPQAREVVFPILLTSNPPNADVFVQKGTEKNRTALKKTPLIATYKEGQALTFFLKHKGCKETAWALPNHTICKKQIQMEWAPIGQFAYDKPVSGQMTMTSNGLLFSSRDGQLYLLSPSKEQKGWSRSVGLHGDLPSQFTVQDHRIYMGNIDGAFFCIEANTGKALWQLPLEGAAITRPCMDAQGNIYASTQAGSVYRIKDKKIHAVRKLVGRLPNSPVLVGHILVTGSTSDFLTGLTAHDLAIRWQQTLSSDVLAGPFALGDNVVVITADSRIQGCHGETGTLRWSHTLPALPSAEPFTHGGRIYLSLENGTIMAYSGQGQKIFDNKAGNAPMGPPVTDGRHLFVGDGFGHFMALDARSGALKWKYAANEPIASQPCIINSKVIFATTRGNFVIMAILP